MQVAHVDEGAKTLGAFPGTLAEPDGTQTTVSIWEASITCDSFISYATDRGLTISS